VRDLGAGLGARDGIETLSGSTEAVVLEEALLKGNDAVAARASLLRLGGLSALLISATRVSVEALLNIVLFVAINKIVSKICKPDSMILGKQEARKRTARQLFGISQSEAWHSSSNLQSSRGKAHLGLLVFSHPRRFMQAKRAFQQPQMFDLISLAGASNLDMQLFLSASQISLSWSLQSARACVAVGTGNFLVSFRFECDFQNQSTMVFVVTGYIVVDNLMVH
jgi:hypothetical protein